MALEDLIAQRYQGYISIEALVKLIAKEYECSEEDALIVLSDAIKSDASHDFRGDLSFSLSLYRAERVGPKLVSDFTRDEMLKGLYKGDVSASEELFLEIPF